MNPITQCMEDYKESLLELEQDAVILRLMLLGMNKNESSSTSALLRISNYLDQHIHDLKTLSATLFTP